MRLAVLALSLLAWNAHAQSSLPAGWQCTGVCGWMAAQGDIGASPEAQVGYGFLSTAGSTVYGSSPLQLDPNSRGSGTETNGSRLLSPSFSLVAGETFRAHFNYASTDGKGFDDYAWARLVRADTGALVQWLFTARSSNSGTRNIVPGDVLPRDAFDPRTVLVNYDEYEFNTRDAAQPIDWTPLGFSNGSCWRSNAAGCGFTGWLTAEVQAPSSQSYRLEIGIVNWGDEAYDSALAFDLAGLAPTVPEPRSAALLGLGLGLLRLTARKRQT
ncbi:MAG: NF038132 family protein [Burkholderiales bacterium]|nr:NF038132 family protein [Burkholderiales bacterium]